MLDIRHQAKAKAKAKANAKAKARFDQHDGVQTKGYKADSSTAESLDTVMSTVPTEKHRIKKKGFETRRPVPFKRRETGTNPNNCKRSDMVNENDGEDEWEDESNDETRNNTEDDIGSHKEKLNRYIRI